MRNAIELIRPIRFAGTRGWDTIVLPGSIGVYQINCRIPGAHIKGDGLPITLKIGGVSSPTTGNNVPSVYVE
jgi:hypothetical protein